jgi:hypothetical protein
MRCAQPDERAQQRSAVRCGASKGRSEQVGRKACSKVGAVYGE